MQEHQNDNQHKGLGKGMITASWILAIAVLTLYFGNWEKKQFNPNSNPESQLNESGHYEVTLIRNRFGHYVTTGYINGEEVELLVDTGATDVAIPENIANHLGLRKGAAVTAYTANGPVIAYNTSLDSIRIGDIVLYDVDASIIPSSSTGILLGMSFINQVEMDQRGNKLILRQTVR